MSEKPRVYQGVRVKTTVKELLQRHRAREASSKKLQTVYLELKELCASTFSSRNEDPSLTVTPTSTCSGGSRAPFPTPDVSCSLQMQVDTFNNVQQQFGDVVCPGYNPSYNTSLPPLPTSSPLPWSQGLSSDADFYGHGMAVCSSSESLTLCNPMDPNSYSPQDSFSSSSSSCYDSPTRMESSYHSFPSDPYHHHHQQLYNPHQNYMSSCQQESLCGPEYTPYYNTSDYPSAYPVMESYRKDFPVSPEMCYNVL